MPPVVESGLISQLTALSQSAVTVEERRSALYDLALCTFAGLGMDGGYLERGLSFLIEASKLGSVEVMAISFRLHDALGREPPALRDLEHPIVDIERQLTKLDRDVYFVERIWSYERFNQQGLLQKKFDIFHKKELLISEIRLQDVQKSFDRSDICLDDLKCAPHYDLLESKSDRESLITLAARLGLLYLIEFLFATFTPSTNQSHRIIAANLQNSGMLTAACRGGHLEVVKFLLSQGAQPSRHRQGTPFHWLMMFPVDEVGTVLRLLMETRTAKECLKAKTTMTNIGLQSHLFHGTPLEIALSINCAPLLQLF